MQHRVYQTKFVAWMNGGWSTSGVALNSRPSTWLVTTSVEDFEHASIWKEDNSNITCELTILIFSVSVIFSVTFVWLLPCYIIHSKSVPATSTIRHTRVFVLQVSAAEKSGYCGRFYSKFGRRYLLSDMLKKLLKSDSSWQSYSKCYRDTLFWLAVSCAWCAECIYNNNTVRWQIQFHVCVLKLHSQNSERIIQIDLRLNEWMNEWCFY